MKPEAILFDLDDTILADGAVYEKAWGNVLQKRLRRAGDLDNSELWTAIKQASEWYYSDPERMRKAQHNIHSARREGGTIKRCGNS